MFSALTCIYNFRVNEVGSKNVFPFFIHRSDRKIEVLGVYNSNDEYEEQFWCRYTEENYHFITLTGMYAEDHYTYRFEKQDRKQQLDNKEYSIKEVLVHGELLKGVHNPKGRCIQLFPEAWDYGDVQLALDFAKGFGEELSVNYKYKV